MHLPHTSLGHLFTVQPLAGLSVVLCLVTIVFCFSLRRRRNQHRTDRFLVGFLGLIATYQGLHVLQKAGIVTVSSDFDGAIELVIASFYLLAALALKFSAMNRLDAESAMRLARAAPPRSSSQPPIELALQNESVTLGSLAWALPRLSDTAFKLYAFLCLHPRHAEDWDGKAQDIRLETGKTAPELETALGELQQAGAIALARRGSRLEVQIAARDARNPAGIPLPSAAKLPAPVPEIVA